MTFAHIHKGNCSGLTPELYHYVVLIINYHPSCSMLYTSFIWAVLPMPDNGDTTLLNPTLTPEPYPSTRHQYLE